VKNAIIWIRESYREKRHLTIEIIVNGDSYQISDESTVIDLVRELKLIPERVAIELNRSILARAVWAQTKLRAGDRLEIVHFVGGGSS
jgi:sulfur carrier protein